MIAGAFLRAELSLESWNMKISTDELEEKARLLTKEALRHHAPIPDDLRARLTLGMSAEGKLRTFSLYIAGEKPEDAITVTQVSLNSETGEASAVEVFPSAWLRS